MTNRLELYETIKGAAGVGKQRQKLVEEIAELQKDLANIQMNLLKGKYDNNRHELNNDIFRMYAEMADVIITTEQALDTEGGLDYVQMMCEVKIRRLRDTVESGELMKGMTSVFG